MIYHIRDATYDDAPALADTVIEPMITTFRGLVPDHCLSWLTREASIANWQTWFSGDSDHGMFLHVAEMTAGVVVGCALGGPQHDDPDFQGELYLLGVLPTYQGQGIGRHLVISVAQRLTDMNIPSMRVRVLTVNPNRYFYERLGGQYIREQPYAWNGVMLTETIYGWPDIALLLRV